VERFGQEVGNRSKHLRYVRL